MNLLLQNRLTAAFARHITKAIKQARESAKLYEETILKGYRYIDLTISTDGAGAEMFHFLPHFPFFTHDEAKQHEFLKISCEFTMIYGYGVFIHVTLSDLEKGGANKTLECIYQTLLRFLRSQEVPTRIRNLYVGMDNTNKGNKCWTVNRGLASLVALGICEKVKVTFGLVGHTKGECDAVMGLLLTGLAHKLFLTIGDWKSAIIEHLSTESNISFHILDVNFIILIPDYDAAINNSFGRLTDISGLMRTQVWRHCICSDMNTVVATYQEDVKNSGQLPRLGFT